jgi:crotonobetainyl-CoA:carnitine CoA-transferase CaiB-like acyl-CoA transferase
MLPLLSGIRVIDFTSIVLGPYATQILGDLGADVIKVEPPQGDLFRAVRPGHSKHMGAGFMNLNRNKRSLAIDLKNPAAGEAVGALVAAADVVVHNMRPSSAAHLGLSYDALRQINPRVVYALAPGFDQRGRDANAPAYDDIIQASSGLAHLNANQQGQPRYLPTIVCDKVGGLHLAIAVLAGIAQRARTGSGCCVEAPMFESMVSFLMTEQLGGRTFVPPLGKTGYERLSSPNRRPFRTKDGYLGILPYNTAHWAAFFELIDRPEQAHGEIVQNPVLRSQSIDSLYGMIAAVTPDRTTEEWLGLLSARDIPCARVNSLDALLDDLQLQDTGFFKQIEHPTEGTLLSTRSPFHCYGQPEQADLPAPTVGGDGRAILASVGLSAERIDALASCGAVRLPS